MKNLAVFFGGRSVEHDVSIITGTQLIENADASKYNIMPVYISRSGQWYAGEKLRDSKFFVHPDLEQKGIDKVFLPPTAGSRSLLRETRFGLKSVFDIDVAILAMHGMHGEDGTLQGLMELADIPYSSAGVTGSAAGMDKIVMKAAFQGLGFPVLDSVYFERGEYARDPEEICGRVEQKLGYPVIVKPANLGSSIGISRADSREQLKDALDLAVSYDRRILVEKAVTDLMEINCAVLGMGADAKASLCEQPVTAKDVLDFSEKYLRGPGSKGMKSLARKIPAEISPEMTKRIQDLSLEVFKALDMKGVVRIDYIIDKATDTLYINEANTIPGSFAFYLFEPMGIPYTELIDTLVECALQRKAEKEKSNYAFDSEILKKVSSSGGAKMAK